MVWTRCEKSLKSKYQRVAVRSINKCSLVLRRRSITCQGLAPGELDAAPRHVKSSKSTLTLTYPIYSRDSFILVINALNFLVTFGRVCASPLLLTKSVARPYFEIATMATPSPEEPFCSKCVKNRPIGDFEINKQGKRNRTCKRHTRRKRPLHTDDWDNFISLIRSWNRPVSNSDLGLSHSQN